MVKTPQTYTFVAGANQQLPPMVVAGKHLKIISCSQATVLIGFDGDPPEIMYPDYNYPAPGEGFKSITVKDASGAGCTVVVTISAEPVVGQASNSLASIDARLARLTPGDTIAIIVDKNPPALGGAPLLIAAARPARKRLVLFGDPTMTGLVYLGPTGAAGDITAVKKMGCVQQYGMWADTYTGALYALGSDGAQVVCGYELY